jgi:periplasmic protein TonB
VRRAPQDHAANVQAVEDRAHRRDRIGYFLAFAGAVLLHASTALGLVYWHPPEPVAPPGDMVLTFDLEPAVLSDAKADHAGKAEPSAPQAPQPPMPPEEEMKEEELVEEIEPTPEAVLKEEVAKVPKAKEADVIIAPKQKRRKEQKPKPKPAAPSQAAASASTTKSDVGGIGASASPSEINAFAGRVRAAIERRKSKPAGSPSGTVYVAFGISRSGGISGLRLTKSSGSAALDGAARAAVAGAGIPPIPEGLPAPMSFGVPIYFK